jgi:hypothetical protein
VRGTHSWQIDSCKAEKGRLAMQSSPQSASGSMHTSPGEIERPLHSDDLIYQIVTVAAILLVLASLWVF